jgi:hypothetical protein
VLTDIHAFRVGREHERKQERKQVMQREQDRGKGWERGGKIGMKEPACVLTRADGAATAL